MIQRDWFDWTNSGIGVAGLLLTTGAIWQATGAKRAASEARQAVYRRNALDDLRRLERLASGLATSIEAEEYGLAIHQVREFIAECRSVGEHHRSRLGANGGKLDQAYLLVRAISKGIWTNTDKDTLSDYAQRLVGDNSSLAGALSRDTEEER